MPTITRSALVPYGPEKMFDLVNEVKHYPDFLSWCVGARVLEQGDDELTAELIVRLAGIEQRFSTRNALSRPHGMSIRLLRGPFREFHGRWSFRPLGEGSKVALSLAFEFGNGIISRAFRSGFSRVAEQLVTDFCARADRIYGD